MQTVVTFLKDFWHQTLSVLSDAADFMIMVFDKNSGPWPKIIVGGVFLLIVLLVVMRTSKPR